MSDRYQRQNRGDASAYDLYLRSMDGSMRQKVALTAAHLLCEGELADMGMGSGTGSDALAALYPELTVIGVDVNPEMVERARERYPRPNLRFVEGDVAASCFDPGTLEAILDSSVIHHVTSFNGYDRDAARRAFAVQARQLAADGVLILRDFVDPGPDPVWLDLPAEDGHDDPRDVIGCSTAVLFERFASEFRSLLPEGERGFPYEEVAAGEGPPLAAGWRRFRCAHTHAAELLLRKDYRESWEVEVQEEYTFGTQRELTATFEGLGLRVLASTPIYNPWIVAHRFEGKLKLWTLEGRRLDVPATNVVVVGQRVRAGEGVSLRLDHEIPPLGYLERVCYERDDGRRFDLARRPGVTLDVIPWFERDGALYVLARRSYPRPVLAVESQWTPPDRALAATYVTEPLNVQQGDEPIGTAVEASLAAFPALGPDRLRGFSPGARIFPSPGGIQEEVRSTLVEVEPVSVQARLENLSGFSTSGVLRAIEARQLLRAAQVGGLPDARLELDTYELLRQQGRDPGDWIGASIPAEQGPPPRERTTLADLARRPARRRFRRLDGDAGFLAVRCGSFVELDAEGNEVARQTREWVEPRTRSVGTVSVAVILQAAEPWLGLDDDDLPAAQCFDGNSQLLVTPAWRLPREVEGIRATRAFLRERLEAEHGVEVVHLCELGGRYHPSAGLTPEVVYPFAAVVREGSGGRPLKWVTVDDAVGARARLRDGHLRIAVMRVAHALGRR